MTEENEIKEEKKEEREWKKNEFYIPKEVELEPTQVEKMMKAIGRPVTPSTAFRTHDNQTYVRSGISGVITKYNNQEVKGKAAKKAAKRMRHK